MRRLAPRTVALLALVFAAPVAARAGDAPSTSALAPPAQERPRLIVLKVDGLSPLLLDALMDPDNPAKLGRLPDAEGFRRAAHLFRQQTGRRELLPNLRHYFYQQGVRAENMFSATTTLSAVAWGVLETGQPSVVKRHMTFNRNNGFLRGHLDGYRDSVDIIKRRGRKTNALWELDQAGVSLFSDAFHPLRRYETPFIFYRLTPRDYLVGMADAFLTGRHDLSSPLKVLSMHLARRVEGMDYPDFAEEFAADHLAEKILELDAAGRERYDYLTTFFTIDHQQHVDPHPENLVHRLVRLDARLGRILRAVERSQRRDQTLVVLVSDHGSEYEPGAINLAFPLTRAFRMRALGGHNVATVMAEDAGRALTTPIQGIDYPRLYQSPYSPYGKKYSTAFIDNFGNARAEVHLRNNDLNRLHLLLQARRRKLDEDQRARWRVKFRATLAAVCGWLEPERENYRAYHQGVAAWLPALERRRDYYWRDAAFRLRDEYERDAKRLGRLDRLAELCAAEEPVRWVYEHDARVRELIPTKYFGPRNSIYQLSHYTLGLDAQMEWIETTVDQRGRTVPMDYFRALAALEAPNPPLSHETNPVDLIVTRLPLEAVRAALAERGWLDEGIELRQAIWIVSTAQHNLRRGGQALLLEAGDGRLRYLPVRGLEQDAKGRIRFESHNQLDPLGLLYDSGFRSDTGEPAFIWLRRFHPARAWLRATYGTHYSIAPLILTDIAGLHTESFIDNPEFQAALAGFPSDKMKQRYLQGLRWKYASQQPDLLLWSSYLWNFSSKSHTAGGSHGGLTPQVTRTTFMLWGGEAFGLPEGATLEQPATTLDIAPTVARLLGMLDAQGRVIRQAGAVRERPFLPFPGTPLLPAYQFAAEPRPTPSPVATRVASTDD